jgi:uncharacterized protein (DUF934 family)
MCGGLSPSGCSFMRSRKKFFIPVRVLSQVFRGKFLFYLKKAFDDYQLKFTGESLPYSNESGSLSLIASLYDTCLKLYTVKSFLRRLIGWWSI